MLNTPTPSPEDMNMSDKKISMKVKHRTISVPGEFGQSTLKLRLEADRDTVKRVEKAVEEALHR